MSHGFHARRYESGANAGDESRIQSAEITINKNTSPPPFHQKEGGFVLYTH